MTTVAIDIQTKSFRRLNRKYVDTIGEVLPTAYRLGLRRARDKARTEIWKEQRQRLNPRTVNQGELYKLLDKGTKEQLKGTAIEDMQITMVMPKKGFQLIRFVQGSKEPTALKGKKIQERKKVKVKIGRTVVTVVTLKKAYITKAKGNFKSGPLKGQFNRQVFQDSSKAKRRSNGKKGRFAMSTQSVASLSLKYFFKITPAIEKVMKNKFEFELKRRLNKQSKFNRRK